MILRGKTTPELFHLLLVLLAWTNSTAVANHRDGVFEYNICNGLSNQLLIHASAITKAIQQQASVVRVPDYFIVNGEQTSDEPVLPLPENSVPLATAFDVSNLQQRLEQLGIRMELTRWEDDNINNKDETRPDCPGLAWLSGVDPQVVLDILKAFEPSAVLRNMAQTVQSQFHSHGLAKNNGVCFHHRDGQDWHDHCQRWSAQQAADGVYRGNCEAIPHKNLLELLENRALTSTDRWIYYCGDHEIPQELQSQTQYTVLNKDTILSLHDKQTIQAMKPDTQVRDLWALVDFFICGSLRYLVGNSVSTFSALQIALREQEGAYWYNSQSIPLGAVWSVYQVPIVYTYTELSATSGKYMLQASIASLRQHMPHNKVYILYHGDHDTEFRQWLWDQRVTIFQHNPEWKDQIEQMRLSGNAGTSHLFLHAGNYFGTWQRIDIPKFIDTEYAMLIDADTLIIQPFTLNDFGLKLTQSLGMSAERYRHHVGMDLNAGVTLMNVAQTRASYDDFLQFILDHVQNPVYQHPAPSDQGAYLEFYNQTVQQLSPFWNWKAYWGVRDNNVFDKVRILHFHGMKPHDYVRKLLGLPCHSAILELCDKYRQPIFRETIKRFLLTAASIPDFDQNYCTSTFHDPRLQKECAVILDGLARGNYNAIHQATNRAAQLSGRVRQRMHDKIATDGYLDGDNMGLNKKVVTVTRPAERITEGKANEQNKYKLRELSYDYLKQQKDESSSQSNSPASELLRFQLMSLTGFITLFMFYAHCRENRRLLFVLVCGSVVCRHVLALIMVDTSLLPD